MGRSALCVILILGLVAPAAGVAGAPEDENALSEIFVGPPPGQERVLEGVLTIYMAKMAEALTLTEEQAARTFPKIRESFQARWRSAARRRQLLGTLERTLDAEREAGLDRDRVSGMTRQEEISLLSAIE